MNHKPKLKILYFSRAGVVMLPAVIVASFLVLIIVLGITFVSTGSLDAGVRYRNSGNAFFAANTGINEALMQLSRNPSFATASMIIPVTDGSVNVSVQKDIPSIGKTTITALGTSQKSQKKLQMIVSIATDGKITEDSFKELAP